MKSFVFAAFVAVAAAAPATTQVGPLYGTAATGIAGFPANFEAINAVNGTLEAGAATTSTPPGSDTKYIYKSDSKYFGLFVQVGGGQQIFVDKQGRIAFAVPHEGVPAGGQACGFTYQAPQFKNADGKILFKGMTPKGYADGFALCTEHGPSANGGYPVYAYTDELKRKNCTAIAFAVDAAPANVTAAYEYNN